VRPVRLTSGAAAHFCRRELLPIAVRRRRDKAEGTADSDPQAAAACDLAGATGIARDRPPQGSADCFPFSSWLDFGHRRAATSRGGATVKRRRVLPVCRALVAAAPAGRMRRPPLNVQAERFNGAPALCRQQVAVWPPRSTGRPLSGGGGDASERGRGREQSKHHRLARLARSPRWPRFAPNPPGCETVKPQD
jgi:hypothetical protein